MHIGKSCRSRILLPWYVHQFLHGGFCYVHSFGCVLHSRQFRCAVVDLSGVAARPAMGQTTGVMVSACRDIGQRLPKGGHSRRHLGGAHTYTLPLRTCWQRRHEGNFWVRIILGAKPPPHSNKPKEPITGRSYNFPFGGHPVNQFSTTTWTMPAPG